MLVPLSWLNEFVEIDLPVDQLAEILTMAGLEVTKVVHKGAEWDQEAVVVGEIVEVKPHPNADRLNLAVVDYGRENTMTVVTGAPNLLRVDTGKKVVFATTGARLIDSHSSEKKYLTLKPTKIRGVFSEGMVCSEKELGISDEHQGIIFLDPDAPVGKSLNEYLGDEILELDLTPNLAHALSIRGVARELAALTGKKLKEPATKISAKKLLGTSQDIDISGTSNPAFIKIDIIAKDLCSRYSASLIKHVTVKPSPYWLQYRLRMAGMRPINNVVDITNYCMLEGGQPLHAFDYDKLSGAEIIVRRAHQKEKMTTLDGVTRDLDQDMLLITDGSGPVAIAGVMGGEKTEVGQDTTNVLLESANFNLISIRRTAQKLKLPSEASLRFGRGLDPELTIPTVTHATSLMRDLASEEKNLPGVIDAYPVPVKKKVINLDPDEVKRVLGMEFTSQEISDILQSLQFGCENISWEGKDLIKVTVPSYRLDVSITADLVEEIVRIHGYHRIPTTLMEDSLPPQRFDPALKVEEQLRDILVGCGLTEVISYSLISLEIEALLNPEKQLPDSRAYVKIINPITKDREYLRNNLLSSMLEVLKLNLKHTDRVAAFEIGRSYLPQSEGDLPLEPHLLAIGLTGQIYPSSWKRGTTGEMDFFYLKGVIENLLKNINIRDYTFEPASHPTFNPGRAATLILKGEEVGIIGELSPLVRDNFDLPPGTICLSQLSLGKLVELREPVLFYRSIPRFPSIKQDMALVMDEEIPASRVMEVIRKAGGKLLNDITLFDLYQGEQIPRGQKSLTFSMTYQAKDRNLTDNEVQKIHKRIENQVAISLEAHLRG